MRQVPHGCEFARLRTRVGLYDPGLAEPNKAWWRINGYRATVIIWTAEEWERLKERPIDAQYLSCGVWCALRIV